MDTVLERLPLLLSAAHVPGCGDNVHSVLVSGPVTGDVQHRAPHVEPDNAVLHMAGVRAPGLCACVLPGSTLDDLSQGL